MLTKSEIDAIINHADTMYYIRKKDNLSFGFKIFWTFTPYLEKTDFEGLKMDATKYKGNSGNFLNAEKVIKEKLKGKAIQITDITETTFDKDNKKITKLTLSFKEHNSKLTLNATNIDILITAFGEDTDKWIGKKITLSVVKTKFKDELVNSIQIETD